MERVKSLLGVALKNTFRLFIMELVWGSGPAIRHGAVRK